MDARENVRDLLTKITENEETVFRVRADTKTAGDILTVERRQLQPEPPRRPERADTPPRNHVFHTAGGFVAYLDQYKSDHTVIFANATEYGAKAVLDETAGHGVEAVSLRLLVHPLAAPWTEMATQGPQPLREFVAFLRTNRRSIVRPAGRELVLALSQVTTAQEVTVHEGQGKSSLNGLLIKTTIQGQVKTQPVDLPEEITVRIPFFVGSGPDDVTLDVVLESGGAGEGVQASLVLADFTAAWIRAFDAAIHEIAEFAALNAESVILTYGEPHYGQWALLK